MDKELEDCSIIELKAMVYDRLAMIQRLQQEINVVNQRIELLSKADAVEMSPTDDSKVSN